jgi:beta-lactamase class A
VEKTPQNADFLHLDNEFSMKKHLALSLFTLSLRVFCPGQTTIQQLKQQIQASLHGPTATYAVAFKDLSTGEELLINEQEIFHAASTMKTPVLIEVFRQVKEGRLSLNDSVLVRNEFKSIVDSSSYSLSAADDSELKLYDLIGKKRTLKDLVNDMITYSSNLATNMVIGLVDAKNVMHTMHELGANHIQVLRGVEDSKAFEKGLNNTTTAYDLMIIFEKIGRGQAVSPAACRDMIEILLHQHFNTIIPARLPREVKVAHKTGNITGVLHDSGIIILPDGHQYVLVLLSKNIESDEAATNIMAGISEMIYKHVSR